MARPDLFPEWATSLVNETRVIDNQTVAVPNKIEPDPEWKNSGELYQENLPRQYINYQFNLIDQWIKFLDGSVGVSIPEAIFPLTENEEELPRTPSLDASGYVNIRQADSRDYREFQIDVLTGDFSSPVWSAQENADYVTVDTPLALGETYKWRCRDVSSFGFNSEWSEVNTFTVKESYIATPDLLYPQDGDRAVICTTNCISGDFSVANGVDTHVASFWEAYDSFGNLLHQSGRDTTNLTTYELPCMLFDGRENVYIRVKYEGAVYGESSWSYYTRLGVESSLLTVDDKNYIKGYLSVGANPGIYEAFYNENDIFSYKQNSINISVPNDSETLDVSRDGLWLATTNSSAKHIIFYKKENNLWVQKQILPIESGADFNYGLRFSVDSKYLYMSVFGSGVDTIRYYERNGDVFTEQSLPTAPTTGGEGVDVSKDDQHIAVALKDTSPYVAIYKRDGSVFTRLSDLSPLPSGYCTGVAYSYNSEYLVVTTDATPFVHVYKRSGDTYTKLPDLTAADGAAGQPSFSPDDSILVVPDFDSTTNPFTAYSRSGDTFTKLPAPPALSSPESNFLSVWSKDGTLVTVGGTGLDDWTYKVSGTSFTFSQGLSQVVDVSASWMSYYPKP